MAAADLAARDLVDGVRVVAARRLAAGGAQTGGEPRAAPRGGDAEAHAQAWLVVVFHGLALTLSGRGGSQWRLVGGRASGGRGGQDSGARALGLWERTRHGRCGKQKSVMRTTADGGLPTASTENRQGQLTVYDELTTCFV